MESACKMPVAAASATYSDTTSVGRADRQPVLKFKRITLDDLPEINRVLQMSPSLTCDYSVGGIYMWIDYFRYRYCIVDDTLFIQGVQENHLDKLAFSCPVGKMPLVKAIGLIEEYCSSRGLPLRFSAVPADRLTRFTAYKPQSEVEELTDWFDYVYEIESFATLAGKKMAKKRNHVNRFMADNPDAFIEPLTASHVPELRECLAQWCDDETAASATGCEEMREVIDVLEHLDSFPFEGAVLRPAKGEKPVAFTIGEKINDTLYVHIEKINHAVAGAGETMAHKFAEMMLTLHPDLRYLNREEDCGDEGLRHAKESWHPAMLLKKYNITY